MGNVHSELIKVCKTFRLDEIRLLLCIVICVILQYRYSVQLIRAHLCIFFRETETYLGWGCLLLKCHHLLF